MPFSPLSVGKTERIVIEESSPAFQFADGVGTFKAFELQGVGAASVLVMETALSSGFLPSATILMPKILFLGFEKEHGRNVTQPTWTTRVDFFRGPVWSSHVPIPSTSRYAVVYFAPRAGESVIAFSDNGTPHLVPKAFIGELHVGLK